MGPGGAGVGAGGGGGVGPGGGGVGNGPGGAGVGVAGAGVGFCGAGVGTWHFWSPQLEHLQSLCPLSETHWSLHPLGVWSEHLLVFQHQHLRCFLQSRQLSAKLSAKADSAVQPHRKAHAASSWIRRISVGTGLNKDYCIAEDPENWLHSSQSSTVAG